MKGDAEPIYQAEDLKAGDMVKPPADPFREGYSFKGWLLCRGRRRMGWQAGGKIIRHMHPSRPGNRMTGCKYGLFYREESLYIHSRKGERGEQRCIGRKQHPCPPGRSSAIKQRQKTGECGAFPGFFRTEVPIEQHPVTSKCCAFLGYCGQSRFAPCPPGPFVKNRERKRASSPGL